MPEIDSAPEVTVTPVEAATEAAATVQSEPEASGAQPAPVSHVAHPNFIPVFKEPERPASNYDFIPTAAAPVDDLEIPREPALQETAEETTRNTVADRLEPGLMSTIGEEAEIRPAEVLEEPAVAPAEASAEGTSLQAPLETVSEVSDADFEARVAAAMAAYNHASENEGAHAQTVEEPASAPETYEGSAEQGAPTEVQSFEYQPPAGHAQSATTEVVHEEPAPAEEPAASVEAEIPEAAAAAAADSGADHHTIANAIHRVMERLKT